MAARPDVTGAPRAGGTRARPGGDGSVARACQPNALARSLFGTRGARAAATVVCDQLLAPTPVMLWSTRPEEHSMSFDPSLYDTVPQTNVAGTLALVRSLVTAGTSGPSTPAAKKALKRVREAGESLRSAHQAAPPARLESQTRAADTAVDRIWNAVEQRLVAHLELGGKEAEEARRIHEILFPSGLGFLAFKYREQWAEGEAVLARIASEGLEPALDTLVGKPFLEAVRERQRRYGEVLGITQAKPLEEGAPALVEPLREVRRAISTYVRVWAAAADNGDVDARDASAALAPLDTLRTATQAQRKKGARAVDEASAPPVSPAEPLPPVD